jgi:Fur family ferric uptake transcriptional regulator
MKIENILKEHWKSVTKERIDIFSFILSKHLFSASDLISNFKNLWRASVFRTLNLFIEIWILRRIPLWEKWDFYELNEEKAHHEHMRCEKCSNIINFDSEEICKNIFKEAEKYWFKIKEHSINVVWICKNCLIK